MTIPEIVGTILLDFSTSVATFFPQFFAGLLILTVGLIVANVGKKALMGFLRMIRLGDLVKQIHLSEFVDITVWEQYLGELLKWSILILFLVAAVEAWGLRIIGELLNQLLVYLPNIFVAVIMVFIGVTVGKLVEDIIRHSAKSIGAKSARNVAVFAHWTVLVFTVLLVLHQLGVASDLIRILFTGFVAMIALSGGLAFGLGGQSVAKKILEDIYSRARQ